MTATGGVVDRRGGIQALRASLDAALRGQGYPLDTFDADFILSSIMSYLAGATAVLTGEGVRRFKRVKR